MCVAPRGHGSVALGHSGRLCAGDEIQRAHEGVVCSDHPMCAIDLRLETTAAAESLAVHFCQAVHTHGSGALPWSLLGRRRKTQILLMGSHENYRETQTPIRATRMPKGPFKADQASGNDDPKKIPGPFCSGCSFLVLMQWQGSLGSAVSPYCMGFFPL